MKVRILLVAVWLIVSSSTTFAQTTSFTYQGRLIDGGTPANGSYDLQFALWDSLNGGNQIGSPQTLNAVGVSNGIFTVALDFGNSFSGAPRFLEISTRLSGAASFTLLAPRQAIRSTPYSIRALAATAADSLTSSCLHCVTAIQVNDISGSQITGNNSIGGNLLAVPLNLSANASTVLSATNASDAGGASGILGTISTSNPGGFAAGVRGINNGTGNNGIGVWGSQAGSGWGVYGTTSGNGVGVYGLSAGDHGVGVLGEATGPNGLAGRFVGDLAVTNGSLGIGTTAPLRPLQIGSDTNALFTLESTSGSPNAGYIRFGDNSGWKLHFARNRETSAGALNSGTTGVLMTIQDNGRVGIGTTSPDQVLSVNGNASKAGGGSWASFSDERLKNIKGRFTPGLNAVMRLQPLRYEYKPDNALSLRSEGEHVGFSAQAVQKVIPEAVTTNDKGYLLVNNDPILWTMLNAIKEQQAQIETQQLTINRQQQQIEALQKSVCQVNRRTDACKRKGAAR